VTRGTRNFPDTKKSSFRKLHKSLASQTNAILTCTTCNDIFRSRYDLNMHVRRHHQLVVKVKFQNGGITKVRRGEDNAFECKCGKSFKLPDSLRGHATTCRTQSVELDQAEREVPSMDDASESMDLDDEVVDDTPADCYRALFHAKLAKCRGRETPGN